MGIAQEMRRGKSLDREFERWWLVVKNDFEAAGANKKSTRHLFKVGRLKYSDFLKTVEPPWLYVAMGLLDALANSTRKK
jgi:hypothetical protein